MRKLTIAAATTLITVTATAQQPLQCLNPDILNGAIFLGRSESKMELTRALPAFMSGFRMPADLTLIGSGVRGPATYVAYKTPLSTDKAFAATVTALSIEGWAVESQPGSGQTFMIANGPRNGTVCRNGERRGLTIWDAEGTRYINIISYPVAGKRNCNEPESGMSMGLAGMRNVEPRFQFPAGTSLARGAVGGGGSSSSGGMSISTSTSRVITTETPTRLVEHLAGQLQGQGWRPDSDWSGAVSAGSTWRKIIEGQLSWGTLEIISVSAGTYDVDFTITSAR